MTSPNHGPNGRRPKTIDPSLRDIVLVDQLPSDAWAEGIVVRPSGSILATRIDAGELYSITPSNTDEDVAPQVIHTFPARCVINISRLEGGDNDEEYAIMTAHIDFNNNQYHSTAIWRAVFAGEGSNTLEVTKIADLPEAVFCLGMVQVTDDVLLAIDTAKSCIWRVRISSGEVTVLFSDEATMRPKSSEEMFGANRLRLVGGYIYYTNTSTGGLHRVPAELRGLDVAVTGSVQTVVPHGSLDFADGLVVTKDATTAYATSYVDGLLRRVDIDPNTGTGIVTTLMDELISPTAMDLVYKDGDDKPTLYVVCCGAVTQNLMDVMGAVGFDYAGVDKSRLKIEVTITTEVTVTYETVGSD